MNRVRWLVRSPWRLILLNAAILAVACGAGWIAGSVSPGQPVAAGRPVQVEAHDFARDASSIIEGNLRVVVTLLLGACTGGLLTVTVLVWNAYHLGFGLSMLARTGFADMSLLMRYLPFEFAALGLASAASLFMAGACWRCLIDREDPQFSTVAWLLVVSMTLLVVAGVIEADVKQQVGRR